MKASFFAIHVDGSFAMHVLSKPHLSNNNNYSQTRNVREKYLTFLVGARSFRRTYIPIHADIQLNQGL